ncbi:uncharacterized protein LOC107479712 [Arachis duranensis]|uniref:Uncharacterized protein LOC107479712 n=1 Tax=Arachis duranensis TaxID=130453 RepID=A0A6P4CVR1_ARADU|nr:uncharacterized protein LOC107479712 [Arachis duranensis]
MGNCSIKGTTGECHHTIRILSDSGAILQFKGPKTVGQVLQHYPGYGVFLWGHPSTPLQVHETLAYGIFYYLLPLKEKAPEEDQIPSNGVSAQGEGQELLQWSEVESKKSDDTEQPNKLLCAEGACNYVQNLSPGSALEVLPSAKNGVWRVKLVIGTRQLEEILSEQVNTEALIEKMRMAASSSPTRSRTMATWKVGWKPTLFHTLLAPISRARITASEYSFGSG